MSTGLKKGIYEQVVNQLVVEEIENLVIYHRLNVEKAKLDPITSHEILSQYLGKIIAEALLSLERKQHEVEDRVQFCNELISTMIEFLRVKENPDFELIERLKKYIIQREGEMLLSIADAAQHSYSRDDGCSMIHRSRPITSISGHTLFTGSSLEPRMESELKREILSCDRIDFLVSFVKWTGLRLVMSELKQFTDNGGNLRVITTSYMGATDYKAIEWLSKLSNTEIKISYDTERTRLHAKTYVFWRNTGFSTAYIGSSNLSESAMTSGLEWNLKVSEYDSSNILHKIYATFETYWNSNEFIHFEATSDGERLKNALLRGKGYNEIDINTLNVHYFDINPHHYQQVILDQLEAERNVHNHFRNLVIAATGTGKTVISAFDYKRFKNNNKKANLLFVAHRKEILEQSLYCFRNMLRDQNFGGLLVDGLRPESLEYVFVSIQSLNSINLTSNLKDDFYDFIIIDEFHHAAAPSYQSLLNYFKPKILLGLTATPERADGESIFKYFDNPEAIQLRLTEAIDQKLLCPFHYFGVTDSVDFRKVRWSAGKYNVEDLENLLVLNDIVSKRRAEQVKKAIENYALAWDEIIGIGFCVSKKHAAFMAAYFNESGIPSECLTSDSDASLREIVKQKLIAKEIHFVFVVDLYNEGVDIPEVNTVLFLRPTESLTIFLQQLGRGLRLATGKEALTVIDFVGHQNVNYDFESRFRAVIKKTRRSVSQEIEDGFVHVPKGCSILLEKVAQKTILNHIASAVNSKKQIIRKLNDWKNSSDSNDYLDFYQHWHVKPLEVYRINQKKATLSGLINANESSTEMDQILAKGFARLSQVRAVSWLKWLIENLPAIAQNNFDIYSVIETDDTVSMRWLDMLYYTFYTDSIDTSQITLSEVLKYLFGRSTYFDELMTIIRYAYNHIDYNTYLLDEDNGNLELHAVYTVNMVLSALGKHNFGKRYPFREGVLYLSEQELDVFFITLNKSESDYSETTLYDDYAISEKLFHWQSQSRTSVSSSTGIRYVTQRGSGRKILLFARPYKSEDGYTSLYTCLGYADYVSHEGSSPINIVWELYDRIPGHLLNLALKAE